MTRLTSRADDGYTGAHLWKRVWGDMKDLYGREWKRFYASAPNDPPAPVQRETREPDQDVVLDVREAVARLKPGPRRIVELIAFEGKTHAQVGEELGINEQAVTMRYARARLKLAEMLEAYA